jgi:hypothetical protein
VRELAGLLTEAASAPLPDSDGSLAARAAPNLSLVQSRSAAA